MTPPAGTGWRVFPWDPAAAAGGASAAYSATHVPARQGAGRFDLGSDAAVMYLAETPEHAIAEKLQRFRGQTLDVRDLRESGHLLALVAIGGLAAFPRPLIDCCDPAELVRLGLRPDQLASRDKRVTQAVARRVYADGASGLRWWSALSGDWHSLVLFLAPGRAEPAALAPGEPIPLSLEMPALRVAADALGLRLSGKRR